MPLDASQRVNGRISTSSYRNRLPTIGAIEMPNVEKYASSPTKLDKEGGSTKSSSFPEKRNLLSFFPVFSYVFYLFVSNSLKLKHFSSLRR